MSAGNVSGGQAAERQHVHSSYIWLGSLRAVGLVLFVLVVSSISSIASLIELASDGLSGAIAGLVLAGLAVGFVVLLFGVIVLVHFLAYRHLWYEVGPEEFSLYSGILSKKRVHVPYQRIQSVDQRASLLQRIFGVCNVTIDTAGGAANKAVLVPYLTKQQADLLRAELFARKQGLANAGAMANAAVGAAPANAAVAAPAAAGAIPAGSTGVASQACPQSAPGTIAAAASAPATSAAGTANVLDAGEAIWDALGHGAFAGSAVDAGAVTYEYGLTNKELVFTGLSNNTAFVVAVLVVMGALAQTIDLITDIVPGSEDVVTGTIGSLATSMAAGPLLAMAIGGIIAVAVVVWAASMIGACIGYGGFHARRRGDRIEVERGLLQHQIQGVSIARVQSVVVKQSLIRRLLGYCELSLGKVDAASEESNQKQNGLAAQGLIVHPFVKMERVPEILAGLVPEFSDRPAELQGLPKVALRRGIVRRAIWQGGGFWLAVVVAVCQAVLNLVVSEPGVLVSPEDYWAVGFMNAAAIALYCVAAVLLALDVVGAVLWQRSSGFGVNRRFMSVVNGGLSTETVTFPRQKIQYGFTKTNPLQRHAGTATLHARTAAGVGGTTVRLIDVETAAADGWLAWLEPRKA